MLISNPVYHEFVALGLIDPAAVEKLADETRDQRIPVYRDRASKIIFLGKSVTSDRYYTAKTGDFAPGKGSVSFKTGEGEVLPTLQDSERRFRQFEPRIRGRTICDFGTGAGHFLMLAYGTAAECCGVELRQHCLDEIAECGFELDVRPSLAAHETTFNVITMFHVLEHIPNQVGVLRDVLGALKPDGTLIVEVPHAEDLLIQSLDIPEFRAFTFWSEHLVLHTRESLRTILMEAGFEDIDIQPFQRYGFTNHLRWLLDRKPGGHDIYAKFENPNLEAAYRAAREADFTCDTLIATARKP